MAKKSFIKTSLALGTILGSVLISRIATAGVVFTPPPQAPSAADNEEFPESHFGATGFSEGFGQGYAARQVNDMESPDEESGKNPATASRGIASVGENPNSGAVQNDSTILPSQAAASQEIPQSLVARKGVQEVSIIASDLGYFPKTVFVSRDVPVRLYVTGSSKNTLCIMMDSFQIRKQIRSQKIEEITFLPSIPGSYRFYCPVNGMEGNLVVKEFSSPFQSAEGSYSQPQQQQQQEQQPHVAPEDTSYRRVPAATTSRNVPEVQSGWQSAIDPNEK